MLVIFVRNNSKAIRRQLTPDMVVATIFKRTCKLSNKGKHNDVELLM